jgi:hypothetical protein
LCPYSGGHPCPLPLRVLWSLYSLLKGHGRKIFTNFSATLLFKVAQHKSFLDSKESIERLQRKYSVILAVEIFFFINKLFSVCTVCLLFWMFDILYSDFNWKLDLDLACPIDTM